MSNHNGIAAGLTDRAVADSGLAAYHWDIARDAITWSAHAAEVLGCDPAAVDTGRPVQPLRLTYHHRDGTPSTATAFLGDDSLWASVVRISRARRTVVHVDVRPLQLPGTTRSDLAARCQALCLPNPDAGCWGVFRSGARASKPRSVPRSWRGPWPER